ncbi:hypothetical protein HN587_00410 [Candidatus Woesearchaeota archaeon]|jgi:putative membrane protein|nr:hypothetical protein [Candidatus Woesearchaeota archaeon]
MFIQIFIAIFIGVFLGIITGLIPGIHVNLISILLITLSPILLSYTNPIVLSILIIALSTTHSFLDAIPSIFLGAPDADQALNVLPGHKLFLQGKGVEAVKLTVIGSLLCLITSILLVPIFIPIVTYLHPLIKNYIGYLLAILILFMILKDKTLKKILKNIFIFTLSGTLGLIILTSNFKDPLFPMLSGLFGTSTLIISLTETNNIPIQSFKETLEIKYKSIIQAISGGTVAGFLTSFFPGMGPAQGAVLASQFTKNIGDYGFMILVGGINTVNFVLSLITFLILNKARNGAVIAVSNFLPKLTIQILILFLASTLLIGGIATILTLKISKIFAKIISKVNYQDLVIIVITLITCLVFALTSFSGLIILIISTFIGILPPKLNTPRHHSMGCLLLPITLFLIL